MRVRACAFCTTYVTQVFSQFAPLRCTFAEDSAQSCVSAQIWISSAHVRVSYTCTPCQHVYRGRLEYACAQVGFVTLARTRDADEGDRAPSSTRTVVRASPRCPRETSFPRPPPRPSPTAAATLSVQVLRLFICLFYYFPPPARPVHSRQIVGPRRSSEM